jgi:hypothetical protein
MLGLEVLGKRDEVCVCLGAGEVLGEHAIDQVGIEPRAVLAVAVLGVPLLGGNGAPLGNDGGDYDLVAWLPGLDQGPDLDDLCDGLMARIRL